jgi:hypothetical protein
LSIEYINTTPHCGRYCWRWEVVNKKGQTKVRVSHSHANAKRKRYIKGGGHNFRDKNLGKWTEKRWGSYGSIRRAERDMDWRKEY